MRARRLPSALTRLEAGTTTAQVSFGSNDGDESPFNFLVSGVAVVPPAVQIIDNGATGFNTVGEWTRWTGQGYESDIHESLPGTGTDVATWTFSGLMPGLYRVAATWTTNANRVSNAPFTVFDGTTLLTTNYVNQKLTPSGFSDAGGIWQYLGDRAGDLEQHAHRPTERRRRRAFERGRHPDRTVGPDPGNPGVAGHLRPCGRAQRRGFRQYDVSAPR